MRTSVLLLLLASFVGGVALGAAPKITRAAIERSEDGAAVFPPDAFTAGETIYFNFYVEGYTRVGNAVKISFEAQPKDASEAPLAPPVSDEQTFTLTPEDNEWNPKFRGSFNLPSVLAAGAYHLTLRVKDEFSRQVETRDVKFLVAGVAVEKSAELTIRNLAFYRTDDDEKPLATAAYRLTEEVHARFQIAGYRYGDQGANNVSYGISVTDRSGRILFGEPNAAEDKSAEFYPKPFVPGILSFSLKPGTPPGEYVLTVTARDVVGNQTAEARGVFRLE